MVRAGIAVELYSGNYQMVALVLEQANTLVRHVYTLPGADYHFAQRMC